MPGGEEDKCAFYVLCVGETLYYYLFIDRFF